MSDNQNQDINELVDYKVKKRVAKKVMHDIHHRVEEIKKEEHAEKKYGKYIAPFILAVSIVLVLLITWSQLVRLVSGLIQP